MSDRIAHSHTVLTLKVDQKVTTYVRGEETHEVVSCKFVVFDLAGSEIAITDPTK